MLTASVLLVLRLIIAWMFLYPVKSLMMDWAGTVGLVKLITPFASEWFARIMILVMIVGSLSILFGIFSPIGAALLSIYSLIGIRVHYRLAGQIQAMHLNVTASASDQTILDNAKKLGIVGHITSAQKNLVIAAVLWVIMVLGSGSFSLT